ncbi:MAG: type IV secretory system conjugative DNA transfer family protein [Alphaproteobacteria bacterium]|nr:type IV secretory system conjugative DNA transfer family protein [Alphaproteobacteria bacterium]
MNGACLSEGQRVDMKAFPKLWAVGNWEDSVYVIADKGYDFCAVRSSIRTSGKVPIIPRRQGAVCPGLRDSHQALYKTRSAAEMMLGETMVDISSVSLNRYDTEKETRSISTQKHKRALMTVDEILQLGSENQIVLTEHNKPLKCAKAPYYRRKEFSRLLEDA